MDILELQKQAQIGRQAMNINIKEIVYQSEDSDGNPIEGTESHVVAIYNQENISSKEADELLYNDGYINDPRILIADPQQIANIFPHRGQMKKTGGYSYWKSREDKNDFTNCECSSCGFILPAYDAVEIGTKSTDYVDIKYRFCPKCGAIMGYKPNQVKEVK